MKHHQVTFDAFKNRRMPNNIFMALRQFRNICKGFKAKVIPRHSDYNNDKINDGFLVNLLVIGPSLISTISNEMYTINNCCCYHQITKGRERDHLKKRFNCFNIFFNYF
jgi:hypothetical protein